MSHVKLKNFCLARHFRRVYEILGNVPLIGLSSLSPRQTVEIVTCKRMRNWTCCGKVDDNGSSEVVPSFEESSEVVPSLKDHLDLYFLLDNFLSPPPPTKDRGKMFFIYYFVVLLVIGRTVKLTGGQMDIVSIHEDMYETTKLAFVLAILYKMTASVYTLIIVDKIIVQQSLFVMLLQPISSKEANVVEVLLVSDKQI
uniref:Uncharacterized protein n=1 Tax=Solanum lycopersicum TaxID=4081 RepID=A0A3Q7F7Y5_SOLLC